jgi:pyruvate/2-oxoglutarate dehydrogenase complex dihydrolipoamide dehydrogenase (E3) component
MTEILRPDFCVIGGGPGGMAAARRAAALGAEVAIVEKRPLGAVEPLRGAVQAELLAAAAANTIAPRGARLAGHETELSLDFRRLAQEADVILARYAREDSAARLGALRIRLIAAAGSFTDRSRFEAGDTVIEAKHFLVALGSRSTPPAVPGLELVRALSPEKLGELALAPKSLAVIGARAEELMFVQGFLRLGAKATVFSDAGILAEEDPELAAPLLTALQKEGLQIATAKIFGIEPTPAGLGAKLTLVDGAVITVTHIVCAPERLPLLEGLGLKAAGVAYDKKGIKADGEHRSTNPRIHAIWDDIESLRSIKAARTEGEWVAQRLFGAGKPARNILARIVPTDPEIAVVGLSEAEARKRFRKIQVFRAGFYDNLRAETLAHATRHPLVGHIKIIADVRNRVLGAGIVGPRARELIGYFSLALAKELRVEDLTTFSANEPTLSEICQTAALASMPHHSKVSFWQRLTARLSPR